MQSGLLSRERAQKHLDLDDTPFETAAGRD